MTELTGLNKMKANIGLLDDICKMETEPGKQLCFLNASHYQEEAAVRAV